MLRNYEELLLFEHGDLLNAVHPLTSLKPAGQFLSRYLIARFSQTSKIFYTVQKEEDIHLESLDTE